jgi:hypothetical protein
MKKFQKSLDAVLDMWYNLSMERVKGLWKLRRRQMRLTERERQKKEIVEPSNLGEINQTKPFGGWAITNRLII